MDQPQVNQPISPEMVISRRPVWPKILVPLVLLVLLVLGYGVLAKNYSWWPHGLTTVSPSPVTPDARDHIVISKNGEKFTINIITKELTPIVNTLPELSQLVGLPTEAKTSKTEVVNDLYLISDSASKAIVVSRTLDTTTINELGGDHPILRANEFICDLINLRCTPTNVLELAHKATNFRGDWFYLGPVGWYRWDSEKNILLGHIAGGEGSTESAPVYRYDINTKILQKTSEFDPITYGETLKGFPDGGFSPSQNYFIIYNNEQLFLYAMQDLSKPLKNFTMQTEGVSAVDWSGDEQTIALVSGNKVYTLDLETGETLLRYTTPISEGGAINDVGISSRGRFVIFTFRNGPESVFLKAIDTQDNNRIIDLLHESEISLPN